MDGAMRSCRRLTGIAAWIAGAGILAGCALVTDPVAQQRQAATERRVSEEAARKQAAGWREGQAEDCRVCGNVWLEGEPTTLACPNGHFLDLECCVVNTSLTPICPLCDS